MYGMIYVGLYEKVGYLAGVREEYSYLTWTEQIPRLDRIAFV